MFQDVELFGQTYNTNSKKAAKAFEEALNYYQGAEEVNAEASLKKAIKADKNFIDAYQLLAQLYHDQGRLDEAIEQYAISVQIDPGANPDGYRLLAGMYMQKGDYKNSMEMLEVFLDFGPEEVRNRQAGELLYENCVFALELMKHPLEFEPENLGDSVNSELNEYWPSLTVDELTLMYTVMQPMESGRPDIRPFLQEDIYFSTRVDGRADGRWLPRKALGPPLNTLDNEGAQSMTARGEIIWFTACNRRDGQGLCDLYYSELIDGRWSQPVNPGAPLNSRYSEKHPAVSADGRLIYFASNRANGKGNFDLWVSERTGESWSEPVNLGDSINTPGVEQSPFIHPDQQSLYFSSTGWPGMGQADLFLARQGAQGVWHIPQNMGYPLNTHNSEIGLSVNAAGNLGYFASDRGEGGDTDIFKFKMPEELRPVPVSYVHGRVYDARTMKGIKALLQLIDLESGEVIMELESTPGNGDYLLSLPADRDYMLNVSAPSHLFYSDHFPFRGVYTRLEPFKKNVPLDQLRAGSSVVLHNVFFSSSSSELKPESLSELDKVYQLMTENPTLAIEISGHTDNSGTREDNQLLSEQRAKAVVNYLLEKGVRPVRIKAKGYGQESPVADNDSEKGRARNRRTELEITGIEEENQTKIEQ